MQTRREREGNKERQKVMHIKRDGTDRQPDRPTDRQKLRDRDKETVSTSEAETDKQRKTNRKKRQIQRETN